MKMRQRALSQPITLDWSNDVAMNGPLPTPVGQIAAILGLHALAQCPSTWGFLCDVNLVDYDDDFHLRRMLDIT